MMEPLQKRLRLYNPAESANSIAYDSNNYTVLYADEDSGLELDENVQEEGYENTDQIDPDEQLEQTRAQLDLKLKSKFEAIFEKYGRDFTGIGDEIDLRTGEIVVDNGHLFEMQDERDDGTARPSLLEAFTTEPDERFGPIRLDDDEMDEVHDSHIKSDDMEEDDMILFQNTDLPSARPKTPSPRRGKAQDCKFREDEDGKTTNDLTLSLPSEHEILARFGQDLGPKIARYVAQQRVQDDSAIEPAWRTPGLPLATPGKRPILQSILLQPDSDRSPSPKGATSVWAPKMPPGRPRRDGADAAAVFRGETIIRDRTWYSSGYISTTVTKKHTERVSQSRSKRTVSVPLNEILSAGQSKLQMSQWDDLKGDDSSHVYELSEASDGEPDSSGEKFAKSYKPRRSRSNPSVLPNQRAGRNSGLQHSSSRRSGKTTLSSKTKGKRGTLVHYTKADDEALLEWVDDILKQGILLWSRTHWHLLAEKHPRHSYLGWKDRYRRQFYNKDATPSIRKDGPEDSLEIEKNISPSASQSVIDSECERDDHSLSNKISYEKLQEDLPDESAISPASILFQTDAIDNYRVDAIDLETLDPALHPPSVKEDAKMEEPCNSLQQQSTQSDSSAVVLHSESGMDHAILNNTNTFRSPRPSSTQEMNPKVKSSSALSQGENYEAAVVNEDYHEITTQDSSNASGIAKHDMNFSIGRDMPIKVTIASKEDRPLQQVKQKTFGTSYDFSDEEDEVELEDPRRPDPRQALDTFSSRRSVKRQIIDLTGEDSVPVRKGTGNPRSLNHPFCKRTQSPISVSSSSSTSDTDESEDISFFLEGTPPTDESHITLSNILGPDDFYNIRKSHSPSSKQLSQEKGSAGVEEDSRVLFDSARSALIGNLAPKKKTPSSMSRMKSLRKNAESSPGDSIIETPGGTKRRCGENGFRCGKGFCFKCLEG